jgi:hypothetical protein|tara:strand:+ start:1465 stop:2178 length:714 start_codon:yes stop_codon:yes gene_type:complete
VNKSENPVSDNTYRKRLFELGSLVNGNRAKSHAHRSQIIDNVTNGLSSLLTAFGRNRNLMSESTTNIYRSRRIFVESNPEYQALSEGQRQRVMDEIEYQCLKQRSDSNREIMSLNVALTRFNKEFVQLLQAVGETDAAKLRFNLDQQEHNADILAQGLNALELTPDLTTLDGLIAQLTEQVGGNTELLEEGFEASNLNGEKFAELRASLDSELEAIDECWGRIEAQQLLAAELLASS